MKNLIKLSFRSEFRRQLLKLNYWASEESFTPLIQHFIMNQYFIYILTNKMNSINYTGVTNDLFRRIWEHKFSFNPESFTAKYNLVIQSLASNKDYLKAERLQILQTNTWQYRINQMLDLINEKLI